MRCKTFTNDGKLNDGINISPDPRKNREGKKAVILGTQRNGAPVYVSLGEKHPPQVVDGKVFIARAVSCGNNEVRLEHPLKPGDTNVLLRVSTRGRAEGGKKNFGVTEKVAGHPDRRLFGQGFEKVADKGFMSWEDALVELRPGDAIRVKFTGGSLAIYYIVEYHPTLGLRSLTSANWAAEQAIKPVSAPAATETTTAPTSPILKLVAGGR